jgi:hypothetical protein
MIKNHYVLILNRLSWLAVPNENGAQMLRGVQWQGGIHRKTAMQGSAEISIKKQTPEGRL